MTNKTLRPLLVFAHRGEAQVFLKKLHLKSLPFHFDGLYQSEDVLLLITGEGLQNASERLSAVVAALRESILRIVNLGIAGGLDRAMDLEKIFSIRTVYRSENAEMQFKTFTTADKTAALDIISASQRILRRESAEKLKPFANIVDREAWACASTADLFKIPFYCYKLLSDLPEEGTVCLDIRAQAEKYSSLLFEFYQNVHLTEPHAESSAASALLPDGFYASTAQLRQLKTLLKHLCIKLQLPEEEIIRKANPEKIIEQESREKQRTSLLLQALTDILNPFNARLRERLDDLTAPLASAGCRVKFSRDYEDDEVTITARIRHPQHLNKLQNALAAFDYDAVLKVLHGEDKL